MTGEQIRDLTPGSVIITVQVRQAITSPAGHSEVADDLAVTVVQAGGGQAVWDVEPAAAGNTGGAPMARPRPDSGSVQVTVAIAAALVLLAAAFLAAGAGILGQAASACQAQPAPSTAAATIPAAYLADYQQAGAQYGIPWTVLAGIGEVESDQGRSDAPGVHSGANPAGAAGPMQFGIGGLAGNTWGGAPIHPASEHTGGYGIDGDHDGIVDVYDPGDAIPSAAALPQSPRRPRQHPGRAVRLQPLRRVRHRRPGLGGPLRRRRRPGPRRRRAARPASRPTSGRCPPGPPGKSSPTPKPSSASPTCGAPPARTRSTAPG